MQKNRSLYFFLILLFVLGALLIYSCGKQAGDEACSDSGLNVMSFNIRYDNSGDGDNAWRYRKEMAAGTIVFYEADIVGMQEALQGQVLDMAGLLPGYEWAGVGRDDGSVSGEFCPIFFKKSRLELLSVETFWLSETPDTAGSRGWDAALPRIVTWGRFNDLGSGREFFVFNTHFDHRGEKARRESAALLLKKVRDIAGEKAVIVTGDFNGTPESEPYRILTSGLPGLSGFADTFGLASNPTGGTQTFNGFKRDLQPGHRIDYIFLGGETEVRRFGIISGCWDGRFVSDHNPVLAEVGLK
jgi:endonuclease/exonuclease/phosphatase family metal-dependent hydrolase